MNSAKQSMILATFADVTSLPPLVNALAGADFGPDVLGVAVRIDIKQPAVEALRSQLPGDIGVAPGLGPVMGMGMLAADWHAAAPRGLVFALTQVGIPDDEAQLCEWELSKDRPVVLIQTNGRYSEALAILASHGASEIAREVTI